MKSIKKLILTVAGLGFAAALHATPINFLASVDGLTPSSDYSFSSNGTVVLGLKNSIEFIGVTSVGSNPEISASEWLKVSLTNADRLSSLSLALLFNGPEYGDVNEIAQATTSNGDVFQLRLTGENIASLYKNNIFVKTVAGSGTVLNGSGLFNIANPFGYATVTSFTLTGINHPLQGTNKSDFGLYGFTTVPDAGSTLALLGGVLLAFAGVARRLRL
jgi:hypothetical protein